MINLIGNIDINILNFIRENFSNPFMDKLMVGITTLGDSGFIWIVIGILFLLNNKYRKIGIVLLVGLLLTTILGEGIIKNIVQRPRAFITYPDINIIINPPTSYSFPSGHTASSFVSAFIIAYYNKKFGIVTFILATLIGFSRLYLFVHYPSDILVGILLGCIVAIITISLMKNIKFTKKEKLM